MTGKSKLFNVKKIWNKGYIYFEKQQDLKWHVIMYQYPKNFFLKKWQNAQHPPYKSSQHFFVNQSILLDNVVVVKGYEFDQNCLFVGMEAVSCVHGISVILSFTWLHISQSLSPWPGLLTGVGSPSANSAANWPSL